MAEQRRADVDRRDVTENPWAKFDAQETVDIASERQLVVGTAVDVVEHACRQTAAGDGSQIIDVGRGAQLALDAVDLEASEVQDRAERAEQRWPGLLARDGQDDARRSRAVAEHPLQCRLEHRRLPWRLSCVGIAFVAW